MEKREFQGLINEINYGKSIVEKYSHTYSDRCIYLIFPDDREDIVNISYKFISSIAKRYKHIVCFSRRTMPAPPERVKELYRTIVLNNTDMNALVRYAQVVERESLRIVSYVTPRQLDATDLFGIGNITKESYLYRALFGNFTGVLDND